MRKQGPHRATLSPSDTPTQVGGRGGVFPPRRSSPAAPPLPLLSLVQFRV